MLSRAFSSFDQSLKKAEISMTPLIDMVFILLIFFVVTTTFTKETGIKVNKAKAATSQIINKNIFTVAIDTLGNYWHDGSQVALDELVSGILEEKKLNEDLNIVLIPDRSGRVEPLITIMDRLRLHNINRYSLGTQLIDRQ